MPITQGQMIEQMQEARDLHQALIRLREALRAYCEDVQRRYEKNQDVQEVTTTILYTIKSEPIPTDRATYFNERHYAKRAKWNIKAQRKQEELRRAVGIPEKKDAMEGMANRRRILRNEAVQEVIENDLETYLPTMSKLRQERLNRAAKLATEVARDGNGKPVKWPREDPNDKELEYDSQEDLQPFANLPLPVDANDLATGLDLPAETLDNDEPSNKEPNDGT